MANVRPATDESYYNARGERIAIAQHTQYAYGTVADTVRVFAYDGNGQIIARRDGTANGSTIDEGSDPSLHQQHYAYTLKSIAQAVYGNASILYVVTIHA